MDKPQTPKEQILVKILEREKALENDHITFVIPNFLTKKLASWMLVKEDLVFVKSCAMELIAAKQKSADNRNTTIEASLWYSLIITYGKCFTDNQSGYSRLEDKNCFNNLRELEEIHKSMMELRHGFIAHRGDTENEQAIVFMKIPKAEQIGNQTEFKVSSAKAVSPSIEKISTYIKLFDYLLNLVQGKIQKQAEKVNLNFLNEIDQKYWTHFIL